jgi:hypothetical protein
VLVSLGLKHSRQTETDHVDGSIRQVNEGGEHFGVASGMVEGAGVPKREDGADKLDKVFLPFPVCRGTATCMLSVPYAGYVWPLYVRVSVSWNLRKYPSW